MGYIPDKHKFKHSPLNKNPFEQDKQDVDEDEKQVLHAELQGAHWVGDERYWFVGQRERVSIQRGDE